MREKEKDTKTYVVREKQRDRHKNNKGKDCERNKKIDCDSKGKIVKEKLWEQTKTEMEREKQGKT